MHPSKLRTSPLLLLILTIAMVPQAYSLDVLKMDLTELCERAGTITRATVLAITPGTVQAGGAELPTTTYQVEVSEVLKGNVPEVKGVRILGITMLGSVKPSTGDNGNIRAFSVLPDLPRLQIGQEYLLMTTVPSTEGLSTTVGLGQGCFLISEGKDEMTVNLYNNQGLFDGPVPYAELASAINGALGQ